jgi:hypothetical protein
LEGGNVSPFSTNYGNKYISGISREDVELKVNSAHALELEELGFGPPPTTGMTIVEEVPLFGETSSSQKASGFGQENNIEAKKANIERRREELGLQRVLNIYPPDQSAGNYRIRVKGDKYEALVQFTKGKWDIYPKQKDSTFRDADPETGEALIISKEQGRKLVEKYLPKELLDLLEQADRIEGLNNQEKFKNGKIKEYVDLFRKEWLQERIPIEKEILEYYKSDKYPNKDSQARVIKRQEETITKYEAELAALEAQTTPQQKQQAQQSNITVKEGVTELFESNPELANIGTPEQYSQYLDTIFPDSKVKDILYHAGRIGINKFDKKFIGFGAGIQKGGKGFYFADKKKDTSTYEEILNAKADGSQLYSVVLNIKNPELTEYTYQVKETIQGDKIFRSYGSPVKTIENVVNDKDSEQIRIVSPGYTSYSNPIGDYRTYEERVSTEFVVFEPEQIHILGSTADIEGFKKFIGNKNNAQETQKPPVRRIPKSKKTKTVLDIGIANISRSEIESKIQENKDHHKDNCNGIIPF